MDHRDENVRLATTEFQCTVKDLVTETHGKMPDENSQNQIVMEFEYYTDLIAQSTTFDEALVGKELGD